MFWNTQLFLVWWKMHRIMQLRLGMLLGFGSLWCYKLSSLCYNFQFFVSGTLFHYRNLTIFYFKTIRLCSWGARFAQPFDALRSALQSLLAEKDFGIKGQYITLKVLKFHLLNSRTMKRYNNNILLFMINPVSV